MNTPSPFDQYRDAFGAELQRVTPQPVHRTARRRILVFSGAGLAAAAAIAGVMVLVAPSTGSRVDVLGEARAALQASPDSILHYTIRTHSTTPVADVWKRRARGCSPDKLPEIWTSTAVGAPRYRIVMPLQPCSADVISDRILTGTLEMAYGERTQWLYAPGDRWMQVVTGLPPVADEVPQLPPVGRLTTVGNGDPIQEIRDLLAAGKLKDAGIVRDENGRKLRRLVARFTERRGDPKAPEQWPVLVDYRVDARTYLPVVMKTTARQSVPKDVNAGWGKSPTEHRMITDTQEFPTFERLPLNDQTMRLLVPQPAAGTEVIRRTASEAESNAQRRPSAAERRRANKVIADQMRRGIRVRARY